MRITTKAAVVSFALVLGAACASFASMEQIQSVLASREMEAAKALIESEGLESALNILKEKCGEPEEVISRIIYKIEHGPQDVTYCFDPVTNLLTIRSCERETGIEGVAIWEIPENLSKAVSASGNESRNNAQRAERDASVELKSDKATARELNLIFGARLVSCPKNGMLYEVADLIENSGAAKARLRSGDIILKVNGQNLYGAPENRLAAYISSLSGKMVRVQYRRGNWTRTVWVMMG